MIFVIFIFSFWNVLGSVITTKYCAPGDAINCPLVFAFYREVLAAPILLAVCACSRGFVPIQSICDWVLLVSAGVSLTGIQVFFILGLAWTSADVTAFYNPASPVLVVILALCFGMERYQCTVASILKLTGVAVAVTGIALIILDGEQNCQDAANLTICEPVRANVTMCNGTIVVWDAAAAATTVATAATAAAARGDVADEPPSPLVVNASTECCRTCESHTDSTHFVLGNLFVAANILSASFFTVCLLYTSPSPRDRG